MKCKGCWWEEGGRCYVGDPVCDEQGRSNKLAIMRCDQFWGKREALGAIIPNDKLVILSEKQKERE
jgi:hypothetical protein